MRSPRTSIYLINSEGETVLNDLIDGRCLNCIVACHKRQVRSVSCPFDDIRRHVYYGEDDYGKLYICDDKEKTTKNFQTLVELILHCRPSLITRHNSLKDSIRRDVWKEMEVFKHNIVHINSDAINEFYYFIEQEYLVKNFRKMQDKIDDEIKNNPSEAVELISRLARYNLNIKTEISVVSKLNNPDSKPNLSSGNPRDAVMSSIYTLYPLFKKRSVHVNVGEYWEKFEIDYDALQVTSFFIIENAIKYAEKGSTVDIRFNRTPHHLNIVFTMKSLFIEEEEVSHLFEEGFQGEQAKKTGRGGGGIGLYRARRLASFLGGKVTVEAGDEPSRGKDGLEYANNIFTIVLPVRMQIR